MIEMNKDLDKFTAFLRKLNERLIIILQHNPAQKMDPCESDIMLLEELYRLYDTTTLPWVHDTDTEAEVHTQPELFADTASDK